MYPTTAESRANWDKLTEYERRHVEYIECRQKSFSERKLQSTSQLPDITSTSFILHWDIIANGDELDTLIIHDAKIIHSEPACYEGFNRYIEVADILFVKYGSALHDLVPSKKSELNLYGDNLTAPFVITKYRKEKFSPQNKKA